MRRFDKNWLKVKVVEWHKREATLGKPFDGTPHTARDQKRRISLHLPTGTKILFTRDVGHHASGWWKNPDYERCWHLSLSFIDPFTGELADHDHNLAREWVDLFYRDAKRYVWVEPPFSPEGIRRDVYHYRLFCDANWQPIKPRGEVYSLDWTPAGWLSWSDQQAKVKAEAQERAENAL